MPSQPRKQQPSAGEPAFLGDVLSHLFAARGYGRVQADRQLSGAWREIAGEEIAAATRVTGIRSGVLQVTVASSALLGELVSFRKAEFLDKLKNEHAELRIRDIKFRLESQVNRNRASE